MPLPKDHRRRLKRYDTPGHARFLTFSCYKRRPFLRSNRTCRWLTEAIIRARDVHRFSLWAYVFMPTHAHLLIVPPNDCPRVGPVLNSVKQSVAKRAVGWTREHAPHKLTSMADPDTRGRVTYRFWQRGAGHDRNLWNTRSIWKAIDYIHHNPVEAGLRARPEEWDWSSAPDYERTGRGPITLDLQHLPPA